MSELVVVVDIQAAEGRADDVVAAFEPCIVKTHEEEGCLAYALHRDVADPNHLVHLERWRSKADMDAHMKQPYLAELFAAMGAPGLLAAAPKLSTVTSMGLGAPAKGSLS